MSSSTALIPQFQIPDESSVRRLVVSFLAGRNPRTLEAYRQDLADFAGFMGAADLNTAAQLLLGKNHGAANALALDYKNSLVAKELSPATINRRLAALRSLVKLGKTLGLIPWTLEVEGCKSERYRDTAGPGRDGTRRLFAVLGHRTDPKAIRDRAILRLLFDLALRRGEICSLDLEHLDLNADALWIHGKGRAQREQLTLPKATRAALAAWVAVRGSQPGPLFTSLDRATKGQHRLTGTGLYKLVVALGKEAGLKVRPHGLRHAAITLALDATSGDVRKVQRFSRHRDLRVLTIYDDSRLDLAGEVAALVSDLL
jgi:integrase/recombinase XerC